MSNLLGLAAYEDSDEDDISPLHKRRKSTSLVDEENRGPAPIADTPLTENPEAPPSTDASQEAEQPPHLHNPIDSSFIPIFPDEDEKEFEPTTWISPEPGETPPPPRPPSTTPTPPSSSRMNSVRNRREEALPTTQSSLSLVSYSSSAEDEEDGLLESIKEVLEEDKEQEKMEEEETEQKKIFYQEEMDILDSVIDTKLEAAGSASPALSVQQVQIPPAPTKSCPQLLLDQFRIHFEKKERGMDFNMSIRRRKDFRNPSIHKELIKHVGINEIDSNFDREVFDPHAFKPSDFYSTLQHNVLGTKQQRDGENPANTGKTAQLETIVCFSGWPAENNKR